MDEDLSPQLTDAPAQADVTRIVRGLIQTNAAMVGPADKRGLAVFVRDPDGGLPGVQSGNTGWGWLHGEKSLWMRGGRGQGLTRRLLGLTEHEAMARGMQRGVAGHVQPGCAAYL